MTDLERILSVKVSDFNYFRINKIFTDVSFRVIYKGITEDFPVHKIVIMASNSSFLKSIISGGFMESGKDIIEVKGIRHDVFGVILDMIYYSCDLDLKELKETDVGFYLSLLRTAHMLGFSGMKALIWDIGLIKGECILQFIETIYQVYEEIDDEMLQEMAWKIDGYFDSSELDEDFIEILIPKLLDNFLKYQLARDLVERNPKKSGIYFTIPFHIFSIDETEKVPAEILDEYMTPRDFNSSNWWELPKFLSSKNIPEETIIISVLKISSDYFVSQHHPYEKSSSMNIRVMFEKHFIDKTLVQGHNILRIKCYSLTGVIGHMAFEEYLLTMRGKVKVLSQTPIEFETDAKDLININDVGEILTGTDFISIIVKVGPKTWDGKGQLLYGNKGTGLKFKYTGRSSGPRMGDVISINKYWHDPEDNNSIVFEHCSFLSKRISAGDLYKYNLVKFIKIQKSINGSSYFEARVDKIGLNETILRGINDNSTISLDLDVNEHNFNDLTDIVSIDLYSANSIQIISE